MILRPFFAYSTFNVAQNGTVMCVCSEFYTQLHFFLWGRAMVVVSAKFFVPDGAYNEYALRRRSPVADSLCGVPRSSICLCVAIFYALPVFALGVKSFCLMAESRVVMAAHPPTFRKRKQVYNLVRVSCGRQLTKLPSTRWNEGFLLEDSCSALPFGKS